MEKSSKETSNSKSKKDNLSKNGQSKNSKKNSETTNGQSRKTQNEERKKLRKQLLDLTKDIDIEGLLFLIEQANIIKYNMEVDKINQTIQKSKIIIENKVENKVQNTPFYIEAEKDKSSFIFVLNNKRKFFTREEMRDIARICQNGNPANLFNYFRKERSDFLKDCGIKSENDLQFKQIFDYIKSKYKPKN